MADARPPRKPRVRSGPTLGTNHGVSSTVEIGLPLIGIGGVILVIAISRGLVWGYIAGGLIAALGLSFVMRGGTV